MKHMMDGGGNFRAEILGWRMAFRYSPRTALPTKGTDLQMGYPEFDHVLLKSWAGGMN